MVSNKNKTKKCFLQKVQEQKEKKIEIDHIFEFQNTKYKKKWKPYLPGLPIYDRVQNRKNYFEIPAFLPIE